MITYVQKSSLRSRVRRTLNDLFLSVFLARSGEFIEKGEIDLVIGSKSHANILANHRPKLTVSNPHVFSRAETTFIVFGLLAEAIINWFLLSGSYLLENNREFIEVFSFVLFFFFWLVVYGKNVPAVVEQPLEEEKMHPGKNTVTYEARVLKSLFLRLV